MKKYLYLAVTAALLIFLLAACGDKEKATNDTGPASVKVPESMEQISSAEENSEKEEPAVKMNVQVGTYTFTATLEKNDAVRELVELMQAEPVTISMSDYSGFEKVGSLGRSLTTSNSQTTTTAASAMYDTTRANAEGCFDAEDSEATRHKKGFQWGQGRVRSLRKYVNRLLSQFIVP